jgi:hypothetical protein
MKYYDYEWDVSHQGIILDRELDIDNLGWKAGDCFKMVNLNGQAMLVKLEAVEQFNKGLSVNG